MTSWISLLSVCADVVILLALAAAVSSPQASSLARPAIATLAFACAWLITAFDAMRARDWTIFLGVAVIVVSIVVIIATLHIWTQGGDGGESGAGRGGDHGGGGPGRQRPDAPQDGGGGNNPGWWPEFERELASYVAESESRPHVIRSEDRARVRANGASRPEPDRRSHPRSALLIASNATGERAIDQIYRDWLGPTASLWYLRDTAYTRGLSAHPKQYAAHVDSFSPARFADGSPAGVHIVRDWRNGRH